MCDIPIDPSGMCLVKLTVIFMITEICWLTLRKESLYEHKGLVLTQKNRQSHNWGKFLDVVCLIQAPLHNL